MDDKAIKLLEEIRDNGKKAIEMAQDMHRQNMAIYKRRVKQYWWVLGVAFGLILFPTFILPLTRYIASCFNYNY